MCLDINAECNDYPQFVDCGAYLETIHYPKCGIEIDWGWWGNAMDEASESSFRFLDVEMPCCKEIVSLNDLKYYYDCGFACSLIEIYNPFPKLEIDQSYINEIQKILGTEVKIIYSLL